MYDIWFSYDQHWGNTIWIRFESDKEKWEKCIPPWVTCLTLVFINARQSDRSHRHQRRGSTTTLFQWISFGTCFLIQASSMCRQRCHGCCHLRHDAKRTAKRLCILAFSVSVILVFDFFSGKFAFSQVSRQVASATTGTGSKMATVVMLWCDLWTKIVDVSEGSALACVRHFCDGEVRHTGILGVEILGLCLSSKLCTLCFLDLKH